MKNWVACLDQSFSQDSNIFSIVDLHAITLPQNPGGLTLKNFNFYLKIMSWRCSKLNVYFLFQINFKKTYWVSYWHHQSGLFCLILSETIAQFSMYSGMTASLVASGLDPTRCILFQQSRVPQHAELCWILGCCASLQNLLKLSQYKDKSQSLKVTTHFSNTQHSIQIEF